MGGKKEEKNRRTGKEPEKEKAMCCKKYLKKGKHCKDCPLAGACRLPG
jgi:hypothetical protein